MDDLEARKNLGCELDTDKQPDLVWTITYSKSVESELVS